MLVFFLINFAMFNIYLAWYIAKWLFFDHIYSLTSWGGGGGGSFINQGNLMVARLLQGSFFCSVCGF